MKLLSIMDMILFYGEWSNEMKGVCLKVDNRNQMKDLFFCRRAGWISCDLEKSILSASIQLTFPFFYSSQWNTFYIQIKLADMITTINNANPKLLKLILPIQ